LPAPERAQCGVVRVEPVGASVASKANPTPGTCTDNLPDVGRKRPAHSKQGFETPIGETAGDRISGCNQAIWALGRE
jgi:hypothetical protein